MLTVNKEGASSNQWGSHTGNDARVVGVTHDLSMPQMSCPDVSLPPFALSLSLSLSLNSLFSSETHSLLPSFMKHTLTLILYLTASVSCHC